MFAVLFAYGKIGGNVVFALVTFLLYAGNLILNSYYESVAYSAVFMAQIFDSVVEPYS